jgi:hypothetical protein
VAVENLEGVAAATVIEISLFLLNDGASTDPSATITTYY